MSKVNNLLKMAEKYEHLALAQIQSMAPGLGLHSEEELEEQIGRLQDELNSALEDAKINPSANMPLIKALTRLMNTLKLKKIEL
jgi:hypothetical protein